MKTTITYEWDIEEVDQYGDIVDHHHADEARNLPDVSGDLVLVRDAGNEHFGVTERSWAYVVEGALPEFFTDAYGAETAKVPKRFHDELRLYLADRAQRFVTSATNP